MTLRGIVVDMFDGRPVTAGRMHILDSMVPEAQRLHSALVSAFPAYVTTVFTKRGYPLDRTMASAIEEATAFLDVELAVVLDQEYREQRRSPLELFRAALEILASTLAESGVTPTPSGQVPHMKRAIPKAHAATLSGDHHVVFGASSGCMGVHACSTVSGLAIHRT